MALCIYRAVWILPLSDSILRSLCTGSICVQRICVFVCPLIPNLNICPTSPYNIGGSCQTLSIRNCHKLNVFSANSRSRSLTYDKQKKIKSGKWVCENMGGKKFCSFHPNLLSPLKPSLHSMGTQDAEIQMFKIDITCDMWFWIFFHTLIFHLEFLAHFGISFWIFLHTLAFNSEFTCIYIGFSFWIGTKREE